MLTDNQGDTQAVVRRLTKRLARLDGERLKLVQMTYADAIPLDLLKTEQDRVARDTKQAQYQLANADSAQEYTHDLYERALTLGGSSTKPSSPA